MKPHPQLVAASGKRWGRIVVKFVKGPLEFGSPSDRNDPIVGAVLAPASRMLRGTFAILMGLVLAFGAAPAVADSFYFSRMRSATGADPAEPTGFSLGTTPTEAKARSAATGLICAMPPTARSPGEQDVQVREGNAQQ